MKYAINKLPFIHQYANLQNIHVSKGKAKKIALPRDFHVRIISDFTFRSLRSFSLSLFAQTFLIIISVNVCLRDATLGP